MDNGCAPLQLICTNLCLFDATQTEMHLNDVLLWHWPNLFLHSFGRRVSSQRLITLSHFLKINGKGGIIGSLFFAILSKKIVQSPNFLEDGDPKRSWRIPFHVHIHFCMHCLPPLSVAVNHQLFQYLFLLLPLLVRASAWLNMWSCVPVRLSVCSS